MKLATFAVVLLAVVVTGKDRALFSYEFSNKLLGEWLGQPLFHFGSFRHSFRRYDLSGPLWQAEALNNELTLKSGFRSNFTTLPKNCNSFSTYSKQANLAVNDDVEFMTENDVEYLKLQPKLFSFPDFKAGFDSGKKIKQETQDDFGTKSSGKESKVFEDGVKSVKVNYRRLYQQYPDLNKIDGILLQLKNVSATITSTLKLTHKSYNVKVHLKDVELNHSLHYDYQDMKVKLVGSICRLRSNMSVEVFGSDKTIENLRSQMDVHSILLKEACKTITSYTIKSSKELEKTEMFVSKLSDNFYLDMRLLRPSLTNYSFGVRHVGEFIHEAERIKELPANLSTVFNRPSRTLQQNLPWALKKVVNHFVNQKKTFYCDALDSSVKGRNGTTAEATNKTVTKEYVLVDKKVDEGLYGKKEKNKTEEDFLLKVKFNEDMLNSLLSALVANNLISERFNETDVAEGCRDVFTLKPLCEALRTCPKAFRNLSKSFNFSIEFVKKPHWKYVTFDKEVMTFNGSMVFRFNQQVANVSISTRLLLAFENDKFFYDVLQYRLKLTADEPLHEYFDVDALKKLIEALTFKSTPLNMKARLSSSLRDGEFTVVVRPAL